MCDAGVGIAVCAGTHYPMATTRPAGAARREARPGSQCPHGGDAASLGLRTTGVVLEPNTVARCCSAGSQPAPGRQSAAQRRGVYNALHNNKLGPGPPWSLSGLTSRRAQRRTPKELIKQIDICQLGGRQRGEASFAVVAQSGTEATRRVLRSSVARCERTAALRCSRVRTAAAARCRSRSMSGLASRCGGCVRDR